MSQGWRFAGFVLTTLALVATVAVLGPRLLRAGSPEAEIITALKRLERHGVTSQLPFGTLRSTSLQYQRLSVTLDASGEEATVSGTLDWVGVLERPGGAAPTRVSSLGLERMRWRHAEGTWSPARGFTPRLEAILEALERRRATLEAERDPGVVQRAYRALGWYIRSEREEVVASEDFRIEETRTDRPVDRLGTSRVELSEAPDGGFVERGR